MPSRLKRTRLILLCSVSRQTFDTGLNLLVHFCSLFDDFGVCFFFFFFFFSFMVVVVGLLLLLLLFFFLSFFSFLFFNSSSSHKHGKHTIFSPNRLFSYL